jgi:hypothetical protein
MVALELAVQLLVKKQKNLKKMAERSQLYFLKMIKK